MLRQVKIGIIAYAIADFLMAAIAWILFLYFRQTSLAPLSFASFFGEISIKDIFNTLLFIPGYWLTMHLFSGAYFNPYRKSRIIEIYRTLIITILGSIAIYFIIFLNDEPLNFGYYYKSFFVYLSIQFVLTSIGRFFVLNYIKNEINKGRFGYNTLMIGGNQQAVNIYQDILDNEVKLGYTFKGFVYADDSANNGMSHYLPRLGSIDQLEEIIDKHQIEEAIIAIDTSEHNRLQMILAQLSHRQVIIKITPDLYDIISGSVRTSNVFGAVLIEIYPELMP
jgi:FlaA1/EpsC-like NDP-sugar epimerase